MTAGLLAIVAAGNGHPGALLAGLAGAGAHRRRARRGTHRRDRCDRAQEAHGAGPGGGDGRLPGHRPRQAHHHAGARRLGHQRRGAGGGAGGGAATSTPTSTGSIPPTRALSTRPASCRASPTRKCWSWPRWGPRSCSRARSSSPWSTGFRCRYARACERPMRPTRTARTVPDQVRSFATRMRSWNSRLSRHHLFQGRGADLAAPGEGQAGRVGQHLRAAGRGRDQRRPDGADHFQRRRDGGPHLQPRQQGPRPRHRGTRAGKGEHATERCRTPPAAPRSR